MFGIDMTHPENMPSRLVRNYLDALQSGESGDSLSRFFHSDAVQEEYPNRLNPHGQTSDLSSLLERSRQGLHLLSSQRYEIVNEIVNQNSVAIEAIWTGTLAIAIDTLSAGDEMKARFAMFFTCHQGKIVSQHNYDCFYPW